VINWQSENGSSAAEPKKEPSRTGKKADFLTRLANRILAFFCHATEITLEYQVLSW
jgi:hypothetical protein